MAKHERLSVTVSVGTPLGPYGIACRSVLRITYLQVIQEISFPQILLHRAPRR